MQATLQEQPVLSVSELNQFARGVLEMHVGKIRVTGEISNFSRPASGHWYFTLKDDNAQIRCAMFRNRNMLIRNRIDNGMQVIVHGNVSLYEGRGDYQLIADFIEESGLGALQRRFEQLKQQLSAEGLFAQTHKKAIPARLSHLAVITSPSGAVVHDILRVLKKRYPLLPVTLIPASVQGTAAVGELCAALQKAERWNREQPENAFDAVIIGRGGGSLEDLWAFNEETLARAIYACPIPVISAVGHETDTTIVDFIADLRAPTPSAAAEMISPDVSALYQQLDHLEARLSQRMEQHLQHRQALLRSLQLSLKHPSHTLQNWQQQFLQAAQQLQRSMTSTLRQQHHQLQLLTQRLQAYSPQKTVHNARQQLSQSETALLQGWQRQLQRKQQQLAVQTQLLDMVSPLATLQRGYSITQHPNGNIVHSSTDVKPGDTLHTRLHNGSIISTVTNNSGD